jgi:hypothetical protein
MLTPGLQAHPGPHPIRDPSQDSTAVHLPSHTNGVPKVGGTRIYKGRINRRPLQEVNSSS